MNYSKVLTQWTTLQTLFVSFYGKTVYTARSQMLTCNPPALEKWHKQLCLEPVPASSWHLWWMTGRQHHLGRAPSHAVLHILWLLACIVPGCHSQCLWGQEISCLPTKIYLEVCHISVWSVNCMHGVPKTLCPHTGSKHVSGWSGKWHLDSSHCSLLPHTRITEGTVTQAEKCEGQKIHRSAVVLQGGRLSCSASLRVSCSLVWAARIPCWWRGC